MNGEDWGMFIGVALHGAVATFMLFRPQVWYRQKMERAGNHRYPDPEERDLIGYRAMGLVILGICILFMIWFVPHVMV